MSYPDVDHGEVTILIGYDVFEAHIQKETRRPTVGVQGQFAVLFPLDWSLCGPVFEKSKRSRSLVCISRDEPLHQQVEKFIERESSGTRPAQPPKLTPEEERADRMVREWTQLVNGRFEAGLPWVRDDRILPNNRQAAYKHFNHLEKSFAKRDPSYVAKGSAQMNEYEKLGFSRRLRSEELDIAHLRQWYIPFHGVVNLQKPGKLRVVFNASYRSVFFSTRRSSPVPIFPTQFFDFGIAIFQFQLTSKKCFIR